VYPEKAGEWKRASDAYIKGEERKREKERKSGREDEWRRGSSTI